MQNKQSTIQAFTLIELVVVMAIIIILSIVGFVSYSSYIRDGRNTNREALLSQLTTTIDRFIFKKGRPPYCRGASGIISGKAVCYFTKDVGGSTGVGTAYATKAKAVQVNTTPGASIYLPCSGAQPLCGTTATGQDTYGIDSADWDELNIRSTAADPRGPWLLYATDGGSNYLVFTTKEESTGFSTMVRGSKPVPASATPGTDVIGPALGMTGGCSSQAFTSVVGWKVTSDGSIATTSTLTDAGCLLNDGNTAVVPYRF